VGPDASLAARRRRARGRPEGGRTEDAGAGRGLEALAGRIYALDRGRLLAIARQNSDRPEDAEEALNEAFCPFLSRFDPGHIPEPLSWLTTTLKWVCWGGAAGGGAA
jgi:hypothetical protein